MHQPQELSELHSGRTGLTEGRPCAQDGSGASRRPCGCSLRCRGRGQEARGLQQAQRDEEVEASVRAHHDCLVRRGVPRPSAAGSRAVLKGPAVVHNLSSSILRGRTGRDIYRPHRGWAEPTTDRIRGSAGPASGQRLEPDTAQARLSPTCSAAGLHTPVPGPLQMCTAGPGLTPLKIFSVIPGHEASQKTARNIPGRGRGKSRKGNQDPQGPPLLPAPTPPGS